MGIPYGENQGKHGAIPYTGPAPATAYGQSNVVQGTVVHQPYPGQQAAMPHGGPVAAMPYQGGAMPYHGGVAAAAHAYVGEGATMSEATPAHVRAGFIAKVYGILSVQILVTAGVAAPFVFLDSFERWVADNSDVLFAVLGVNLALLIVMACCPRTLRSFPANYIMLFIFTATEGVLVGVIAAQYTLVSLIVAVASTAIITFALSMYAIKTKSDFTGAGPKLLIALLLVLMFGILLSIFGASEWWGTLITVAVLGLFMAFLVYDTQLIVGGKHRRMQLSVDDYAFGALLLYIDVINIFLLLLNLGGQQG